MEQGSRWYRIKELERLSGVTRRNVHFYLEQGLLHQPRRTGRTMAYYDEAHLAKLKHIRSARAKGTPLFAIKAEIDERFSGSATAGAARPRVSNEAPSARPTPSRRGRPAGPRDTRTRILDTGCELFRSNGFRATMVSDITSRLNVGKGTFYYYFADRDELFLECVPRIFEGLFSESWDRLRREHNPLRRLALRAEVVLPVLGEFCSIMALSREALQSKHSKVRTMGRRTIASILQPLQDDLKAGMAAGLIRPLDPKATSVMLIGVMEGIQYLQVAGVKLTGAELPEAMSTLILAGLRDPAALGERL